METVCFSSMVWRQECSVMSTCFLQSATKLKELRDEKKKVVSDCEAGAGGGDGVLLLAAGQHYGE